jgi:CheY-like chemotaxis protein
VLLAENGKMGVDLALQQRPDIVLCDIMMPVMDGYKVLQIFNNNPALKGIPFIFLSAKADAADIQKGIAEGVVAYITKPFGESELLTAIESNLRK